jgi:UDP-N-acetylglucosamine--N-acetylmuramyl-(pentapeptide) pyrophosphoryl-undecaprenol N-acetylglucosamine transferase
MSYLIAAAGTGGHVFPGLSVGEALLDLGVPRRDILYVGGDRLAATVYPEEGFPYLTLELRGLQRSLSADNLTLPIVVYRAKKRLEETMRERKVSSALGMGGYVTIPTALAARNLGVPFSLAEQNAEAGLANKVASRWAEHCFVSFPETGGLEKGEWVGNPVREPFWEFDRSVLRQDALTHFGLDGDRPVLGVFGGSLGAGAINEAVCSLATRWDRGSIDIVHLTGKSHIDELAGIEPADDVRWRRVAFEDSMELFYAAVDLAVARSGGAVAELTATATPAILVPGQFGSAGHQARNARFLTDHGAALTVSENDVDSLPSVVAEVLFDRDLLAKMSMAARDIARPGAARTIARALIEEGR